MAETRKMRVDMKGAANLSILPECRTFVEEACRKAGAAEMELFALKLAVDEAVNNVVVHGYKGLPPGDVALVFEADAERLIVTILDRGRAFPPSNAPPPDLSSDSARRKVGGLGWHLIRSVVDELDYVTGEGGENRLTLVKKRAAAARN
jgi:serine/threonine-protein kinase RsbW